VIRNVNGNREAQAQRTWFGGAGTMNTEQVKRKLVSMFNSIDREFAKGLHYVIPADRAKGSTCRQGGVVGYVIPRSPRCHSHEAWNRGCTMDYNQKYFMYVCNAFFEGGEDYQAGVLIHEVSHHKGTIDVTYDLNVARTMSQQNQLRNARNYQYFAYTVAGACLDDDSNCVSYAAQGYCRGDNVKRDCKRSCGVCRTGGGGGGGGCVDQDQHCASYAQYCNDDRIRGLCPRTCGTCRTGGGGGGCVDQDQHCASYAQYCNDDRIRGLCQRTCGTCR